MFISWVQFMALLLFTGLLFRYVEATWPDTAIGKALLFLY